MRGLNLFAGLSLLFLLAAGSSTVQAEPIYVDGIVAVVGNDIITWSELEDAEVALKTDPSFAVDDSTSVKSQVLDRMIEDHLINQAAARESIIVGTADVDRAIDGWMQQNQITKDVLEKELEKEGISWDDYHANFRKHLTQSRFIDYLISPKVSVTDAQISAYYAREVSSVKKEQVADIWLVFLAYGANPSPETQATLLERANQLHQSLKSGETDFGNAAKTMSDHPSSEEGGYLGSFKRGELFPELDKAAFSSTSGQGLLPPIVTANGIFVVKSEIGQVSDTVSLEQARPQIEGMLYQQELQRQLSLWVEEARRNAHIEILITDDRL